MTKIREFEDRITSRIQTAAEKENEALIRDAYNEADRWSVRANTMLEVLRLFDSVMKDTIIVSAEELSEHRIYWKQPITEGKVGDWKTEVGWTGEGLIIDLHNPLEGKRSRHILTYQGMVEGLING